MTDEENKSLPASAIGVFDSGVGGLTVLHQLLDDFPQESFVYIGDTARLPYGSKGPSTIRRYSEQILATLVQMKVKTLIVACNSASSQLEEFQEAGHWNGTPLFTVIKPGCKAGLAASQSGQILVLGTRATVNSRSYDHCLQKLAKEETRDIKVSSVACPLFVPLAEEGWIDDPITNLVGFRYLQEFQRSDIDCAILGCTHYPILKNSIQKVLGNGVHLVDSGQALSQELAQHFKAGKIPTAQAGKRQLILLASDDTKEFRNLAARLVGNHPVDQWGAVDFSSDIGEIHFS